MSANGMDRRCSPQHPSVERGFTQTRSLVMARHSKDTVAILGPRLPAETCWSISAAPKRAPLEQK